MNTVLTVSTFIILRTAVVKVYRGIDCQAKYISTAKQ
jgi:hypothetical protein